MFGRLCFIHLWDCLEVWLCWLGQGRKSTHHRRWFFIFTMATWRGFLDFAVQCQAPVHFFYVETRYSSTYEGLRRNSILSRNHWAGQTQLSHGRDSCGFPPKRMPTKEEPRCTSHAGGDALPHRQDQSGIRCWLMKSQWNCIYQPQSKIGFG
jgi:hypothetical protein